MRVPLNQHTLGQIRRLINLIENIGDKDAYCKLWVDHGYVSVEVSSLSLPINMVREIMGASQLDEETVFETERRQNAERKTADEA